MKWPQWNELNNNFVLTLHSNSAMVLWNGTDGEKVWEYRLQTVASSLAISPFSPDDLACLFQTFSQIAEQARLESGGRFGKIGRWKIDRPRYAFWG